MTDKQTLAQRNNLIRAAVMGANDGILSVSGIVIEGWGDHEFVCHFYRWFCGGTRGHGVDGDGGIRVCPLTK